MKARSRVTRVSGMVSIMLSFGLIVAAVEVGSVHAASTGASQRRTTRSRAGHRAKRIRSHAYPLARSGRFDGSSTDMTEPILVSDAAFEELEASAFLGGRPTGG